MTNAWKQQEGRDCRRTIHYCVLYLGGSDHSAVFLTELPNTRERISNEIDFLVPIRPKPILSSPVCAVPQNFPILISPASLKSATPQIGSARVVYLVTDYAGEGLSLILPDHTCRPKKCAKCCP